MAYDATLAEQVRKFLATLGMITERKMMGALCFMVEGHMCCGVTGSSLLIRVGRDAYGQTLAEPHVRPMEIAGRSMAGFVLVDPIGLLSDTSIAKWIRRGLAFVSTLPPKGPA